MNELLLLGIFVVLSGFFSMAETALTSISRIKIKQHLNKKHFGSKELCELRENPSKMLSTILIGNNIVNVAAASLATFMAINFFKKFSVIDEAIPVAFASLVMTIVIIIFGEVSPKTIALKHSEKLALAVAPAIHLLSKLFLPLTTFISFLCSPFVLLFGADKKSVVPFVTQEELKMLLSVGEEEGVLEQEEKEMIHSIFEFGDSIAKEVMVPRPDMFCLEVNTPLKIAAEKIAQQGHSRIPVYDGTIDNIVGVVFVRDIINIFIENKVRTLRDILRPPLFVPETKKLDDLMRHLQSMRTHIAIVVDEYGGVAGIVTLEDLLEEIVGEIKDEFDIEEKNIDVLADGSALIDARISVNDVNEKVGTAIPEGDYDTVGGFVLSLSGKLPTVGDTVKFEDIKIIVEKVYKRRITRIKIVKIEEIGFEGEAIVGG